MAHFYAEIQGNRGEATRMGTPSSGIHGHVRGWDIGASVRCYVDEEGRDVVSVSITHGSNGHGTAKCLGQWVKLETGEVVNLQEQERGKGGGK